MTVNVNHPLFKSNDEAQPITLLMRQYYGNENWKKRVEKKKWRYNNDPEYREMLKHKAKLAYYKKKEKQLMVEA